VTLIDDLAAQDALTVDTETAARLFGIPTAKLWSLARQGKAPVRVLRMGRLYRWPLADIRAAVGMDGDQERPS
jgi:predicted DNA-binding transcriptional regulator AlpA